MASKTGKDTDIVIEEQEPSSWWGALKQSFSSLLFWTGLCMGFLLGITGGAAITYGLFELVVQPMIMTTQGLTS